MRRELTRVVLLGGCAALLFGCGDSRAPAPEERAAVEQEVEALRAEKERLEREVKLHERREQHAEEAAERAREALEEATAEPQPADEPADGTADGGPAEEPWITRVKAYPAYDLEEYEEALEGVDWVTVGGNMSAMPPLIAELGAAIASGKPMEELPADLIGRIQQLNGPLVTAALTVMQKGVPGTGANGSFSHPAFMSNAIAASLEAVGLPLTEEQSQSLEDLVRDFARRDAERLASLDDAGVLETILSESDLKHDYFERVYGLLTQEQHDTLRPVATRGRLQLDIFCESLVWTGRAGPIGFSDRGDLAEKVTGWITNRASLPSQDSAAVREIVDGWASGLPDELLAWEFDRLSEQGMMQVEHVTESARAVAALQTALIDGLALDAAGIAGVHAVPGSVVFYRRAPE